MKLAPSLLAADFGRLYEQAHAVESMVDRFHWDVMDGHLVPNLTFGPPVVNALRRQLRRPFDIHLMIEHPAFYVPRFDVRSGDTITFHVESKDNGECVIEAIGQTPARPGVSLCPSTPLDLLTPYLDEISLILVMSVEPGFGGQAFLPAALERIRELRARIAHRPIEIAVDGGIHTGNIAEVVAAGADVIVAGSAIFGFPDPGVGVRALREAVA